MQGSGRFTVSLLCTVLFLAGLTLRLPGYRFGLPHSFHPDEVHTVDNVRTFLSGQLVPHSYNYPPLLAELAAAWSIVTGDTKPGHAQFLRARQISVAAGAFTAVPVFLAVLYVSGIVPALLAAGLLVFSPLHIEQSRYATSDVLLSCMVAIVIWLGIIAVQRTHPAMLLAAAALAGFAAVTKQNGALALVFPLAAAAVFPGLTLSRRVALTAGTAGMFLLGAVIAAPGMFLLPRAIVFMYKFPYTIYHDKIHPGHNSPHVAMDSLKILIYLGSSLPAVLLACAGAWHRIRIRDGWRDTGPLLLLLTGMAAALLTQGMVFSRNLLWTLPGLAVLAGFGLAWMIHSARRQGLSRTAQAILILAVCLITLGPIWMQTHTTVRILTHEDTRLTASRRLSRQDPEKRRTAVSPSCPDFYLPPLYRKSDGITVLDTDDPEEFRRLGFRYVVCSYGKIGRFYKSSRYFSEQAKRWKDWETRMETAATHTKTFRIDHGISARLLGTTIDIFHSPVIRIFDLGPPEVTPQPGDELHRERSELNQSSGPFLLSDIAPRSTSDSIKPR